MELNYSLCISFFFVWQLDRGWFNRFWHTFLPSPCPVPCLRCCE